ncbi:MAG: CDP-alcohol phosphatidyltransferase family protein [Pirellulaceae bacterium]|jgi:phosphatidylglycerophosphate synthase|nr:CDP-alcohol phosphatidyltransferase family protein [Pirellulaceae bacterium]
MSDSTEKQLDRRPIKARNLAIFQRMAAWLADRGVSANGISIAGMLAATAGSLAFAATRWEEAPVRLLWLAGAALTQCRLLANMLDGMVAVRQQKTSAIGELYNEVPDRISDAALLAGVGFAVGGNPLLGMGAGLAAVFTAYIRAMAKAAGAPQDFGGLMAKQQRMFAITVLGVYSALAPQEWQPLWQIAGESFGLASLVLAVVIVGSVGTALGRLRRAARNLRQEQP